MSILQSAHGFDLNKQLFLHQYIAGIFSNNDPIVQHCDTALLRGGEPGLEKFMREGVLVNLFGEAWPERLPDGQGASDNAVGKLIQRCFIDPHPTRLQFLSLRQWRQITDEMLTRSHTSASGH